MKKQDQKVNSQKPAGQPNTKALQSKSVVVNASSIADKIELARKEAYIEPQTRDFLRRLLKRWR